MAIVIFDIGGVFTKSLRFQNPYHQILVDLNKNPRGFQKSTWIIAILIEIHVDFTQNWRGFAKYPRGFQESVCIL